MEKLRFVPILSAFEGFAIFNWKFNFVVDRDGSGYSNTSTLQLLVMKQRLLPATLFALVSVALFSCHKEPSNSGGGTPKTPLEKRADSLYQYVLNQHFVPVDFYASDSIDYNQDDTVINLATDLKPFIMFYLADDIIIFEEQDSTLNVNQGTDLYIKPVPPQVPQTFKTKWSIGTIKATNEVYFNYLNYTYEPRRYILDYYNDTTMLAHVPWESKIDSNDKALLYTLFRKK